MGKPTDKRRIKLLISNKNIYLLRFLSVEKVIKDVDNFLENFSEKLLTTD